MGVHFSSERQFSEGPNMLRAQRTKIHEPVQKETTKLAKPLDSPGQASLNPTWDFLKRGASLPSQENTRAKTRKANKNVEPQRSRGTWPSSIPNFCFFEIPLKRLTAIPANPKQKVEGSFDHLIMLSSRPR